MIRCAPRAATLRNSTERDRRRSSMCSMHIASQQEVEFSRAEGQVLEPCTAHGSIPAAWQNSTASVRRVHARGRAKGAELDEVAARSAAGVEHAGLCRGVGRFGERPDQRPSPAEPPVAVLLFVHLSVGGSFHLARQCT